MPHQQTDSPDTAAAGPPEATHAGELDNHCRWHPNKAGHYEVWYLTFNDRPSKTGFWIRYTLEAPFPGGAQPYAQLWFAAFDARDPERTVAINKRFPASELATATRPFALSIGKATLTHTSAAGAMAGDNHRVRWELRWNPTPWTYRHLPDLMYLRGGLADTTVVSPNLDIALSGTVEVDGRRIEAIAQPGCQTHLWGRKHAYEWAWGHCNAFEGSPGTVLETLTVRLQRRGIVLPPLTLLGFYHEGQVHRFNQLHHLPFTRGRYQTGQYAFSARGPKLRLEGEYRCAPHDMVVAQYHDPDGAPSFCANTEIADLSVRLFRRRRPLGAWQEHTSLWAPRTGHFEVGRRQPDPLVPARHVAIH